MWTKFRNAQTGTFISVADVTNGKSQYIDDCIQRQIADGLVAPYAIERRENIVVRIVHPCHARHSKPAAPSATAVAALSTAVAITSVPPGARIVLNGTDTGLVTPASLSVSANGTNAVDLSLKGYRPLSVTLTAADLQSGTRELRLTREAVPVRLSVSAPYAFEVMQGTRVLSAAATQHELTVQPGGAVSVRSADLLLNSPLTIDYQRPQAAVTLPAPGTLAVFAAVETCSVVVDGRDLGFPPIARKLIAPGSHTVILRCPGGKEDTRRINIVSGERTAVTFAR